MNHYCHLPYTRNHRDRATGNELRLVSWLQNGNYVCSYVDFIARICFALALSSRWHWPNNSDANAECPLTWAWARQRVSGLWNHISVWTVTFVVVVHFEGSSSDQFMSVEFWHVSNSGLCASDLVNLLSRWLLRHASLIVNLEFTGKQYSKSLLICGVINKNCHLLQCDDRIVKTFLEKNPTI